jgi:menaquinone-9 beta-reductase
MAQSKADILVVGGGPAGSVTAWLLANAGHEVLLLDKARFPRHKACSEYINTGGVRVLKEIGVLEEALALGAHRMDAMQLFAPGGKTFLVDFKSASDRFALGLSRFKLDQLLLERARDAGVEVIERAHVRTVSDFNDGGRTVTATIDGIHRDFRAAIVIGADGRHSVVARSLGLDARQRWPHRTGLIAHFEGVSGLDRYGEMHVTRSGYVGMAPLENGLANVAVVLDSKAVIDRNLPKDELFHQHLEKVPAIAEKLTGATRVSSVRGIGPMARRVRSSHGDGYLLVGDAAGFLDPFTGDGIYEALHGAQLAAQTADAAIRRQDSSAAALAPYRIARNQAFLRKRQVCWLVQGFIHAPSLLDYVTPRLTDRTELGATLTGVLGNFRPAGEALSPFYLARLLRP